MELVQNLVLRRTLGCLLVELKNIDHGLGVLPALLLRDTALVDQALPFLGKALENIRNYTAQSNQYETDSELTS